MNNDILQRLTATIAARKNAVAEASYVAKLFGKGEDAILKKIGEEAIEVLLAQGLSLERLLLDVHSGRIFGRYGPWVVDAAAIALLMLGLSGVWIYVRSIKQGKLRHKHH